MYSIRHHLIVRISKLIIACERQFLFLNVCPGWRAIKYSGMINNEWFGLLDYELKLRGYAQQTLYCRANAFCPKMGSPFNWLYGCHLSTDFDIFGLRTARLLVNTNCM